MKPIRVLARSSGDHTLQSALLVYRSAHGGVYVTAHEVARGDGASRLGPGRPIERASLSKLLDGAKGELTLAGWLDARIVYMAPGVIAWERLAAPRGVHFKSEKPIGERAGTTPHPRLIFAVTGGHWYVWAAIDGGRGPDLALFHAPYFNVWESGEICTGNVRLPRTLTPGAIEGFEDAFFRSRFTHPNHDRLTTHPKGAAALWLELLDGRHATFPQESLAPFGRTLGQVMKSLGYGKDNDVA